MVIINYNPLVLWSFPGTGTIKEPGFGEWRGGGDLWEGDLG